MQEADLLEHERSQVTDPGQPPQNRKKYIYNNNKIYLMVKTLSQPREFRNGKFVLKGWCRLLNPFKSKVKLNNLKMFGCTTKYKH